MKKVILMCCLIAAFCLVSCNHKAPAKKVANQDSIDSVSVDSIGSDSIANDSTALIDSLK